MRIAACALLALTVLTAFSALAGGVGSQDDPLVTLSYLNDTFTTVGNDVWIGQDVVIKGGVKIGDGAVIGARSVVTRDVPPYAVVVGVPAKVIKYRFEQEKIDFLEKLQWWNWTPEEIYQNLDRLKKFDETLLKENESE